MFVISVRASARRLIPLIVCVVLIVSLLIAGLLFPASRTMVTVATIAGDTDEDCAAFLTSLDHAAVLPAASVREIVLPDVFDDTLLTYNELQQQAGFDLSDYAGQRVKYRTYTLTDGNAAHLYVYNGRIIGGDITASDGSAAMPLCHAENSTC